MSQAEAVVARAPVVSRDVDALVDTTAIVFGYTFVHICREKTQQNVRAGSEQLFETLTRQKNTFIFVEKKKNQYQSKKPRISSQVICLTLWNKTIG